jgi:hypothetical protein
MPTTSAAITAIAIFPGVGFMPLGPSARRSGGRSSPSSVRRVQTYCDFYQTRKGMSNFHTTVLDRHPTHAKMGWHGIMF